METGTITQLKSIKEQISLNLESYKSYVKAQKSDLQSRQYGSENEYCINGLIGGVKNILTDVSFLVRSHDLFIKISTYTERNDIYSHLSNLNSYISSNQHSSIATTLDLLKTRLRSYNLRLDKDRYIDFNNEIDNLRRKAIDIEEELKQAKERLKESTTLQADNAEINSEFEERYNEVKEIKERFLSEVTNFTSEFEAFKDLQQTATANEKLIAKTLDNVKDSETEFDTFIKAIENRQKQLVEQKQQTDRYNANLESYTTERKIILDEAVSLINNAKQALRYSTAEGISAAFSTQHTDANKLWMRLGWLIGAVVFILITFLFGVWILTGWGIDHPNETLTIIGRLSLIPFSLLGALFCANQYIKQKNLIEDYAYKSVLSKSMVAFSEELREKDSEKYAEYLSTVLREIHQDPLRKRGKDKDEVSAKDSVGLIDKIAELVKIIAAKP